MKPSLFSVCREIARDHTANARKNESTHTRQPAASSPAVWRLRYRDDQAIMAPQATQGRHSFQLTR